jgi:AraC family transcriptional regulator
MQPEIVKLKEKKLIGQRSVVNLSGIGIYELWHSFMPRKKEIINLVNNNLFSIKIYNKELDFKSFTLETEFVQWAAVEVTNFETIPVGMETFVLEEGLYAVFLHKGPTSSGSKTFHYIFEKWFPNSGYCLDNRPHFELLGEKYKNDDPDSEEDIWIPII